MYTEIYSIISTVITIVLGGGWFVYYRANKRKADGEATQSEADGWAKQQQVYQNTIKDLTESCEYIKQDRNLLREENTQLRKENNEYRMKINELEKTIFEMRKELSRQGRMIQAINEEKKNNKKKKDDGNN